MKPQIVLEKYAYETSLYNHSEIAYNDVILNNKALLKLTTLITKN